MPGRVERVVNAAELDILVDYAHTPDALRNVLAALRPLTKRRLICVFGCGGDRDPTKRPKMGAAVAELADLAVVTSDNPRTEEPRAIIDQILPAVPRPFFVDPDRRVAIRAAIAEATPGDVVVVAGKGHEDYQIIGPTKIHFDDREEAAEAVLVALAALARRARARCRRRARRRQRRSIARRDRQPDRGARRSLRRDPRRQARWPPRSRRDAIARRRDRGDGRSSRPAVGDRRMPSIVVDDTRLALGQISRAHRRALGDRQARRDHRLGRQDDDEGARARGARRGRRDERGGGLAQQRDRRAAHAAGTSPVPSVRRRRDGDARRRADRVPDEPRRARRRGRRQRRHRAHRAARLDRGDRAREGRDLARRARRRRGRPAGGRRAPRALGARTSARARATSRSATTTAPTSGSSATRRPMPAARSCSTCSASAAS